MSRYSDAQQPAAPLSSITKEDFNMFREVQKTGMVNMANISAYTEVTGLTVPKAKAIMTHYTALAKLFPDKD
jgi:hypothetical protein